MSDVPVVDPVQGSASPASDLDKALAAAREADWGQVVSNGGPPCFHLEGEGTFCLRAERWQGHRPEWGAYPFHGFVSLEYLILEQRAEEAELWYSLPGTARERAADLRRQASQGSGIPDLEQAARATPKAKI